MVTSAQLCLSLFSSLACIFSLPVTLAFCQHRRHCPCPASLMAACKERLCAQDDVLNKKCQLSCQEFRVDLQGNVWSYLPLIKGTGPNSNAVFAKTLCKNALQKCCFGNSSENPFFWAVVARFIECLYNSNI